MSTCNILLFFLLLVSSINNVIITAIAIAVALFLHISRTLPISLAPFVSLAIPRGTWPTAHPKCHDPNVHTHTQQDYLSNYEFDRDIRKPHLARLRWGKRSDDEDYLNNYWRQLEWESLLNGDRDDDNAIDNIDDDKANAVAELDEQKLRSGGGSIGTFSGIDRLGGIGSIGGIDRIGGASMSDGNNNAMSKNMAELAAAAAAASAASEQKRAPTNLRLRWGRSYNPDTAVLTSVSIESR